MQSLLRCSLVTTYEVLKFLVSAVHACAVVGAVARGMQDYGDLKPKQGGADIPKDYLRGTRIASEFHNFVLFETLRDDPWSSYTKFEEKCTLQRFFFSIWMLIMQKSCIFVYQRHDLRFSPLYSITMHSSHFMTAKQTLSDLEAITKILDSADQVARHAHAQLVAHLASTQIERSFLLQREKRTERSGLRTACWRHVFVHTRGSRDNQTHAHH